MLCHCSMNLVHTVALVDYKLLVQCGHAGGRGCSSCTCIIVA